MKQGRTLQELAAELERQQQTQKDFKAPTDRLALRVDGELGPRLHVGTQGAFPLRDLAHSQLAGYTGIPQKYYDRLRAEAPALLADNVNVWLDRAKEQRLVRTLDGEVRAFLSNRYRVIDNYTVAEAALPALLRQGSGLRVESCEVTETRLYVKAVSERLEVRVKGQAVQAGIVISNSEVGAGAFKVEPLVFILACLNGAILPEAGLRKFHIGRHAAELDEAVEVFADDTRKADDRALMLKLRDVVTAAFDEPRFKQVSERLNVTAGNAIWAEPGKAVDQAIEVLGVSGAHRDGLLAALAREDGTQWGLSNALTAYAQTVSDYEEATRLERAGGEVLLLDRTSWEEIAQAA